jgi:sugar phosphate isomerase/epimerase
MRSLRIACRPMSYAPFHERAYAHLAGIGIRLVEIHVPPPGELDTVRATLARHGLSATSLQGELDLARENIAAQMATAIPALEALDTQILFLSVRAGDLPLDQAYARLRTAGDVAARHGITLVLETHPDLVTNAEVALATMHGVDHPNVRINFDTANVYYYNRDVDAVAELRRIAPYVASVHLKDTDGGYEHWHFPALGEGIVDFPGIFDVLDASGFDGPCTLEIEGIEGEEKTPALVCERMARSAAYLRELGRL